MEIIREVVFYKDYFEDFFEPLSDKVKNKVDEVLYMITVINPSCRY